MFMSFSADIRSTLATKTCKYYTALLSSLMTRLIILQLTPSVYTHYANTWSNAVQEKPLECLCGLVCSLTGVSSIRPMQFSTLYTTLNNLKVDSASLKKKQKIIPMYKHKKLKCHICNVSIKTLNFPLELLFLRSDRCHPGISDINVYKILAGIEPTAPPEHQIIAIILIKTARKIYQ